jgi:hypothetical protein
MPRALDPRQRFPIVLESDKGKEPECRFWFKYLTGAEFMQVDETARKTESAKTDIELHAHVYTALRIGLVDWQGIVGLDGKPIPYQPANLECIIDPIEAIELLAKLRLAVTYGVTDAKKSESPSASEQEQSADSAEATVTSDRPKASPSKSNAPSVAAKGAKTAPTGTSA